MSAVDLVQFLLARIAEDEAEARYWTCDCAMEGFPLQHGLRCEERVKAECHAKREIVDYQNGPDRTVLLLMADVYADHPDYREEWP